MLCEQHELRIRCSRNRIGHELRECKSRPEVRDPDCTEALVREPLAVFRAHDRADRVGVRVVDVRHRHERVQERLNRRPRHARCDLAACEVLHHLLVRHRGPLKKRHNLVESQTGETGRRNGREVAARALHPEHLDLAAGVIDLGDLG